MPSKFKNSPMLKDWEEARTHISIAIKYLRRYFLCCDRFYLISIYPVGKYFDICSNSPTIPQLVTATAGDTNLLQKKDNTVDFFRHQRNRTEVLPGAAYPIKHLKMPIQLPCQHYLDQTKWVAILIQTWKKKHLHIPKLELSNQTHPTKLKPEFKN